MATTKPDIQSVSSIGNLLLIRGTFETTTGAVGSATVVATEDGMDFSDFVSSIVSFNIDGYKYNAPTGHPLAGDTKLGGASNYSAGFKSALSDANGRHNGGNALLEIIDAGSGYSNGTNVTNALTGVLSGVQSNATITVSGGALATVKATSSTGGFTENEPLTVAGGTGGFVRANLSDADAETESGFKDMAAINFENFSRPSILIKNDNIIRIVDHMDSKIFGDHDRVGLEGGPDISVPRKFRFSLIGRR